MKLAYLLFSILLSGNAPFHAIYLSVLEATVAGESIQVEIKVFEDDMRSALRNFHGEEALSEKALESYFDEYLDMLVNGQNAPLTFIEYTLEGESYFIHFESGFDGNIETMEIRAPYFMELFPTQQNILKFRLEDYKEYYIFKKSGDIFQVNLHP